MVSRVIERDITIIGGGIIGCTLARELLKRFPTSKISILDKEQEIGTHASSRNSGVLHAGFYYSSDSLKARFCRDGNAKLTKYIKDNKLPLKECGKIVTATTKNEHERLLALYEQGLKNKVELELIDYNQAKKIEPHLKCHDPSFKYIWSPTTKVSDSRQVLSKLKEELLSHNNFSLELGTQYSRVLNPHNTENGVEFLAGNEKHRTKYFVNAAGLYADTIAHQFGLAKEYQIFPLKGLYIYHPENMSPTKNLHALVYPIPPMKGNIVLGVHFALTMDGKTKLGPTAIPCLWREQYGAFDHFKLNEFLECLQQGLRLLASNKRGMYIRLLTEEIKKYYKPYILRDAARLVDIYEDFAVNWAGDYSAKGFTYGKPGIRAQLINNQTHELENDFKYVTGKNFLQILNLVSPGYTCSFALAEHFADLISKDYKGSQ